MSHIVTIRTQIRDAVALTAACRRLELAEPSAGSARLFSSEVTGQIVRLPGWTYPVVIDLAAGQIHYDNYNGAWGEQSQLDRLVQAYAVEKAKLEARRQGHSITEHAQVDGSIKLVIGVGGGA